MGRDRAAYMREYRARKKAVHEDYDAAKPTIGRIKTEFSARIRELEEEVRHLKAELAKRPPAETVTGTFGYGGGGGRSGRRTSLRDVKGTLSV